MSAIQVMASAKSPFTFLRVLRGWVFRSRAMSAITGDPGDFAALCLRPSARDPTPHRALLKTKVKPQFDRAVDRTVEAFFYVFQGFNLIQFQPCFLVFTVRSAEGRKHLRPNRQLSPG
jgi:hypothetical protein